MIAQWMLYTTVTAFLSGIGAASLEWVLQQRRLPVRGLWVIAMAAVLAIPAVASVWPSSGERALRVPQAVSVAEPASVGPVVSIAGEVRSTEPFHARLDLDPGLAGGWAALSAALMGYLVLSSLTIRRRAGTWSRQVVDGRQVWVSPDLGPAVVGVLRPRIVLPMWVLARNREDRGLVLAHEAEHLRARDPLLLFGALVLLVALPWNPALWWQWTRLRRAIEVDCDLRVIEGGCRRQAYARLLLEVCERGLRPPLAVAALAESRSFLERRIRLMLPSRTAVQPPGAVGALLVAVGCLLVACQVDLPTQPPAITGSVSGQEQKDHPGGAMDGVLGMRVNASDLKGIAAVTAAERLLGRDYPQLLRERVDGGHVTVYLSMDAHGQIVEAAVDAAEITSGECLSVLEARLGEFGDPSMVESWGCQVLRPGRAGPNRLHIAAASVGSASATEPAAYSSVATTRDRIVLSITPGPAYALNTIPVAADSLAGFLTRIYHPRPRKTLFVEAEENVSYGDVIRAIEAGRSAGVAVMGPVPRGSGAEL